MKNRITYITGLPRTRQAWMSAFLDGAGEKVRTQFDSSFHDHEYSDSSYTKVICGSGMLGKIEEILYYKSNPDNDVRVIWIDRNENDSMNALFIHLKSFIPNLTQREFSVLIPQFQQLKDDFIAKVGYDVMYPFKTLNDHLTSLSLYACDYRPSYERVELFKRLRVSEIISPEQGEHLLHLIRGSSLSGDEKKQRVLFDSQSTEIHRCLTPELPDSGYSNSGYTSCTSHSNAV